MSDYRSSIPVLKQSITQSSFQIVQTNKLNTMWSWAQNLSKEKPLEFLLPHFNIREEEEKWSSNWLQFSTAALLSWVLPPYGSNLVVQDWILGNILSFNTTQSVCLRIEPGSYWSHTKVLDRKIFLRDREDTHFLRDREDTPQNIILNLSHSSKNAALFYKFGWRPEE